MITVYECGNGDCLLVEDIDFNLQIDLGETPNSKLKIVAGAMDYDLMISHSHTDHIVGNAKSLTKTPRVVYVPVYFLEYLCIKRRLEGCHCSSLRGLNYVLLYEGCVLYGKHKILNPSLTPWNHWNVNTSSSLDVDAVNTILSTKGTSYEEIMSDIESIKDSYEEPSSKDFSPEKFVESYFKLLLKNRKEGSDELDESLGDSLSLGQSPAQRLAFFSGYFDKYQANDMSIVFHYKNSDGLDVLFTGDAGKKTWKRLIKESESLKCDVLKVPHHGSRNNLNLEILREMKPKVALISHNNGTNGIDKHPNIEIIGYLKSCKTLAYYTNDVKKNGCVWATKTVGKISPYDIEFV